jgi:hypothetical protein
VATGRGEVGSLTERERKIVEALYRLSADGPRTVTYEDIVVKAWQLYPDDFGLRGYADQYPDASDIHKPLYNKLKSGGWVKTGPHGQKMFRLTQSGWERAQQLLASDSTDKAAYGRISRASLREIRHMERTDAAQLYVAGRLDEILDTDFFAFYRTTVRAKPQEFEGRLAEVRAALDEAIRVGIEGSEALDEVDRYLRDRFSSEINVMTERKKRDN